MGGFKEPINDHVSKTVTVLVAIYKGGDFVESKINNLLEQTYFSECHIVLLNCQNLHDEKSLYHDFLNLHNNVHELYYDDYIRLYQSWNDGIIQTNSEFICNSNIDDLWQPDYLEKCITYLNTHNDLACVSTLVLTTDRPNQSDHRVWQYLNMQPAGVYPNTTAGPCPVWRRSLHENYGYFGNYRTIGDARMWEKWYAGGEKFGLLEEPLVLYYTSPISLERRYDGDKLLRTLDLEDDKKRKIKKQKRHRNITTKISNTVKTQKPTMIKQIKATNPMYSDDVGPKIAIIQGGAWGDNINSTLMLKPLREHFENSLIDVHTSDIYRSAFDNNQYIHKIIEYHAESKNDAISLAKSLDLSACNYDIICAPHPMYNHDKWTSVSHPEWGTNLIFAWVRALEDLGVTCDTPETVLKLTETEVNNVKKFLSGIPRMDRFKNIIETHGESGQTFFNGKWVLGVVGKLAYIGQIVFVSSRCKSPETMDLMRRYPQNVFHVGALSIRECAELFNHCDRFFSVSSGLSNACNTNWCKKQIQWIEICNSGVCSSAAIRKDGKRFWHKNDLEQFLGTI